MIFFSLILFFPSFFSLFQIQLRNLDKDGITKEIFEEEFEQFWVTQSTDGRQIPLKPGGEHIRYFFSLTSPLLLPFWIKETLIHYFF